MIRFVEKITDQWNYKYIKEFTIVRLLSKDAFLSDPLTFSGFEWWYFRF